MSVDPNLIEEVKDVNYEDILDEMGIEAEYEQVGNGVDLSGYIVTKLRDMYGDEIYSGRPVLSDIYKVEFSNKQTGETTINWKIDLILFDDTYSDEKEAYVFTVNLKSDSYDVENVHSSSGLYNLTMGLMELKAKGISKAYNKLKLVRIKNLQNIVKSYSNMTVQVKEQKMVRNGEENYYNSFRITEGEQ